MPVAMLMVRSVSSPLPSARCSFAPMLAMAIVCLLPITVIVIIRAVIGCVCIRVGGRCRSVVISVFYAVLERKRIRGAVIFCVVNRMLCVLSSTYPFVGVVVRS